MQRRKKTLLLLLAVGMLLVAGAGQADAMDPKDSALFSYKYEADAMPLATEWALVDNVSGGNTFSVSNGEISYSTPVPAGGRWYWTKDKGTFAPTGDYTVETSLKVTADGGDVPGMGIAVCNGSDYGFFTIATDAVRMTTAAGQAVIASGLDNTAMHTYRVAYNSTAGSFSVWRDGVSLGDSLIGTSYTSAFVAFGDLSSSTMGTASMDYMRFDTSGAYSPVPEPATLSMIAIGGLCALRRRRNG